MLLIMTCFFGNCLTVLELFQSYLTNMQQCVTVGTKTSLSTLKLGVRRGSVLGPILFSVYMNDLPFYIKALCELLADDTFLHNYNTNIDTLINSLQHSIDSLIDRVLGITIDNNLSWTPHVNALCKSISSKVFQ